MPAMGAGQEGFGLDGRGHGAIIGEVGVTVTSVHLDLATLFRRIDLHPFSRLFVFFAERRIEPNLTEIHPCKCLQPD
jgi:hypothetical protein